MAASASDKLLEVGIASATTLDANYTINDASITVASTSGWPTATGVAFAMDVVDGDGVQVPGSYNEYIGVVSSGTSITSVDHMNGTDRNYSAGATTRVYVPVSAERENRIVEWGLVHADQDGTLKAGAVDVAAVLATDVVETAKIKDLNVTTAKIAANAVTPEKWANPYKFSAYRNAAKTIVTSGDVDCDAELFDTNSNFDTSTGRYTAPVDGFYFFSGCVGLQINGNASVAYGTSITKNGSTVIAGTQDVNMYAGAYTLWKPVNGILQLTAGDYVELFVAAASGGGGTALQTGSSNTYFHGFLISRT